MATNHLCSNSYDSTEEQALRFALRCQRRSIDDGLNDEKNYLFLINKDENSGTSERKSSMHFSRTW